MLVVGFVVGLWAARRVEEFWGRVRQGLAVLRTPRRYLRTVVPWQALDWTLRIFTVALFLEAFGVPVTPRNAFLAQAAQSLSTVLPITPAGIGTEQALLVYVFRGDAPTSTLLSFSVGMKVTLIVVNVALGAAAIALTLRTLRLRRAVEQARDTARSRRRSPPSYSKYVPARSSRTRPSQRSRSCSRVAASSGLISTSSPGGRRTSTPASRSQATLRSCSARTAVSGLSAPEAFLTGANSAAAVDLEGDGALGLGEQVEDEALQLPALDLARAAFDPCVEWLGAAVDRRDEATLAQPTEERDAPEVQRGRRPAVDELPVVPAPSRLLRRQLRVLDDALAAPRGDEAAHLLVGVPLGQHLRDHVGPLDGGEADQHRVVDPREHVVDLDIDEVLHAVPLQPGELAGAVERLEGATVAVGALEQAARCRQERPPVGVQARERPLHDEAQLLLAEPEAAVLGEERARLLVRRRARHDEQGHRDTDAPRQREHLLRLQLVDRGAAVRPEREQAFRSREAEARALAARDHQDAHRPAGVLPLAGRNELLRAALALGSRHDHRWLDLVQGRCGRRRRELLPRYGREPLEERRARRRVELLHAGEQVILAGRGEPLA